MASAEVSSHPGPVRDLIAESQGSWLAFLQRLAEREKRHGSLASEVESAQLAFEFHAMLVAANTALLLHEDRKRLDHARAAIRSRLQIAT